MSRFASATVATGPATNPHAFILTGRPGIGKTFLASTIAKVFFIPIESGLKGASTEHEVPRFQDPQGRDIIPQTFNELMEAFEAARKEMRARGLRHLVLDSAAGLERLINLAACQTEKVAHMEAKDFKKVWTAAMPFHQQAQREMDRCRAEGFHVWLIAHSAEADEATAEGDVFKKWDLQWQGTGKSLVDMRQLWRAWADHVLFIDWDAKLAGKASIGKRAVAKYDARILRTRESPLCFAKNRAGLPAVLPATWKDLEAALRAGAPADAGKLRAQLAELLPKVGAARAELEAEASSAKSAAALSAVVSRAQGLIAAARADEPEDGTPPAQPEEPATAPTDPAPAPEPVAEKPAPASAPAPAPPAPAEDLMAEPAPAAAPTAAAPVAYDVSADDPSTTLPLARVRGTEDELVTLYRRAFGLSLTPDVLARWIPEIKKDLDDGKLTKPTLENVLRPAYNERKKALTADGGKAAA